MLYRPYATKAANLVGTGTGPRSNGNNFIRADETVFNDDSIDEVFGDDDQDWLFIDAEQDMSDATEDELVVDLLTI